MEVRKSSSSAVISLAKEAEIQGSSVSLGDPKNGFFSLSFTANDMELWAGISPPDSSKDIITEIYVEDMLDKLNVIYGVKWDAIYDAINTCNLDRKPVRNVLMARGDPAVNDEAEYFELNPALASAPKPAGENGRIDYKDYTPFVIVKQNQVLARRRPRIGGREGKNVHGDSIPYRIIVAQGYFSGENTRVDDRYIYSDIHGQLVESKRVLSVQNTLVIKSGVSYTTGNIVFPGDVIINGPVSDGFKIYSGGSVTIKQTFDVTDAVAKKNLTVAGGIIGRGRALLKVGDTVKTKFINNCRLACRNSVYVTKEIIRSNVYTMGVVDMAERGIILGSSIYAMHGVRAKGIGTKSGKVSRIHCGIDFTIVQEKEKYIEHLKRIAVMLNQMRYDYDKASDTEDGRAERLRLKAGIAKFEKEQAKISAGLSEVLGRINSDENAVIEISGNIAPGTFLEICQVGFVVTETLHKVRVTLDTFLGKLVPQRMEE
ncbi:MAG: FapA family protein [Spirochaetaceae bacterium]|jgi:uncharacterized protein (DUF342 family)|nr:FapA family protein [Spirochaetaceae bacterium]